MKTTISLLALTLIVCLASCIAPREINQSACYDPEYLRLKAVPIDSMTPRQFAYYQTKDKECEEATAAANAVHQEQVGQQENIFLGIGIVIVVFLVVFLAGSTSISL